MTLLRPKRLDFQDPSDRGFLLVEPEAVGHQTEGDAEDWTAQLKTLRTPDPVTPQCCSLAEEPPCPIELLGLGWFHVSTDWTTAFRGTRCVDNASTQKLGPSRFSLHVIMKCQVLPVPRWCTSRLKLQIAAEQDRVGLYGNSTHTCI